MPPPGSGLDLANTTAAQFTVGLIGVHTNINDHATSCSININRITDNCDIANINSIMVLSDIITGAQLTATTADSLLPAC